MSAELSVAIDRASPVPPVLPGRPAARGGHRGRGPIAGARLDNEVLLADQLGASRARPCAGPSSNCTTAATWVLRRGIGTQVVHPKVRRPVELTTCSTTSP